MTERDETGTFDFVSETRPRLDVPTKFMRRDRDILNTGLEAVSRPRRRDRDNIPATRRVRRNRYALVVVYKSTIVVGLLLCSEYSAKSRHDTNFDYL